MYIKISLAHCFKHDFFHNKDLLIYLGTLLLFQWYKLEIYIGRYGMIIHSLLSLNNITRFILHVRDDFEFSASTTEFGPSGQVTNDVTLSMDMT